MADTGAIQDFDYYYCYYNNSCLFLISVENESGRDRSVSTGSQAGDTIVLIKPQVVPEVKRTKGRKKRGSRGVTELKPLRTRQQSYDFHAAENGTE